MLSMARYGKVIRQQIEKVKLCPCALKKKADSRVNDWDFPGGMVDKNLPMQGTQV